jgi:hypothetical protein
MPINKAMNKYCYRSRIILFLIIFLLVGLSPSLLFANISKDGTIVIESTFFKYEIAENGINLHFIDKSNGIDYLKTTTPTASAFATKDGKDYPVTSVIQNGNLLTLQFSNIGFSATIVINKTNDYISMEVAEISGTAAALTFMNVPLNLQGLPEEPFAVCVLSMNLNTYVPQLPALQTFLSAKCFQRFGMKGSKITLIAVPQTNILSVIREVMQVSKAIPYSTAGGAWAKQSKEGYGSYLMNFGALNDQTVDDWIEKCKSLGFNQIDNHGGGNFFKFGSFELNSRDWPDGWNQFKRINSRLHDAGISSIFHTYSFFIDKNSRYVTPVPSPDLGYFSSFTLAKPIGSEDTLIVVKESTESIAKTKDAYILNSHTLRIGNELIEFKGVTNSFPYEFFGCKRGVHITTPVIHGKGEKGYYLKEMFGMFVPGPDTKLFTEIADNTAEIVNKNNFDGIYLDAIDASPILDGPESAWYYGTKFVLEIANHLNPKVGMEMSTMGNIWWHYRSRWEAWDYPVRGYKRFIDIHAKAINGGLLLPLQLGWWMNHTWDPPQTETTFSDDIEYLGCKMIGFDAGLSLAGGFQKEELDKKPAFKRLNDIIRQYEELRDKNYFSVSIKTLLRQPAKEFTLFKENGSWNFKPVSYQKHKVNEIDADSKKWSINNEFEPQPVKLRIESLLSAEMDNNPANIVLTDFSDIKQFKNETSANGVSGGIFSSTEKSPEGNSTGIFSANSTGASPQNGSWFKLEKSFEPEIDLSKNQALGIWIKGDGNGELLNFRLESPVQFSHGARGDHFVRVNFTGWKYFQLIEIESSEFSNYLWPDSRNIYKSYRNILPFNKISKLQLWYNNLPKGKDVSCVIGTIKAIPTTNSSIINPSVTIKGKKIIFPVRIESGMYLEFFSTTNCGLYGSTGELIKEVTPIGVTPVLANGENIVNFSSDNSEKENGRVQITIIGEGKPLQK